MSNNLRAEFGARFRGEVKPADPHQALRDELSRRFKKHSAFKTEFGGEEDMLMRPSVQRYFLTFTSPLEGVTTFMYADSRGFVTTAIGYLIDSIAAAQALPWKRGDGSLASSDEVATEWTLVKNSYPGTQSFDDQYITSLRLSQADVNSLTMQRLKSFEGIYSQAFPNYTTLPADAQLGIASMAWAMGPGFVRTFTKFVDAVNRGDFLTAATESHISNGSAERNAADKKLFENASIVTNSNLDPSILYYPNTPTPAPQKSGAGGVVAAIALATAAAAGYHYREEIAHYGKEAIARVMPYKVQLGKVVKT